MTLLQAMYPPRLIPARLSWRQIVAEVAARHGVTVAEIIGPRRLKYIVHARQEAMYELRQRTSFSYPHIGQLLGERDHATVIHGERKHKARMGDPDAIAWLEMRRAA